MGSTLPAHSEILIGVAGPMTGTYAAFGAQMVTGVQAAVDDLNANGGLDGDLVTLVTADDGCSDRQAGTAAQSLIAKNVRVVVGHFCSYPSLAAAKQYQAAGIAMIAPSASLPALTEAGLGNVLRLASRDDAQGAFAAKRMQQLFPAAKIAVLDDGTAASKALFTSFRLAFAGEPALVISFKPDSKEFAGLIADLESKAIEAAYCACSAADAGAILAQSPKRLQLFGADTLLVPQFWETAGAAGEGTLVSFAIDPQSTPEAKAVLRGLKAADNNPDGAVLQSYAAVQLFAQAANDIGLQNGASMISHLRSGKIFPTVLGNVAFDGKGDLRTQKFVWYKWSNGKFAAESSPQ